MPVVDANVWVSHFIKEDKFHEKCRNWFEKTLESNEDILFPSVALAEVAAAITRVTKDQKMALSAVSTMLSGLYSVIPVDETP